MQSIEKHFDDAIDYVEKGMGYLEVAGEINNKRNRVG